MGARQMAKLISSQGSFLQFFTDEVELCQQNKRLKLEGADLGCILLSPLNDAKASI